MGPSPTWPALLDTAPESEGIDLIAVRRYRLDRLRAEMASRDISALVLSDSVNIRYATGTRNMQVFTSRRRNRPRRVWLSKFGRVWSLGASNRPQNAGRRGRVSRRGDAGGREGRT